MEYWNSEKMKKIRLQMLHGEYPEECQVCNDAVLNIYTYKQYFNKTLFPHKIRSLIESTNEDGSLDYLPVSYDYRISNLCNFKCRMCGEQLSSSWESEKRKHNLWDKRADRWMLKENKTQLDAFAKDVLEKELWSAVKSRTIEEIYWVGGEPLMWEIHWEIMDFIQKNYSSEEKKNITIRYNSNLSRIVYKDYSLTTLLSGFKNVNFCASIDGVGKVGEYIRTGLKFDEWLLNFKKLSFLNEEYGDNGLVLDLTITLPGLLFIENLFDLALELNVKTYIKTTFAFDSSVLMSPMCLPRNLLNEIIDSKVYYFNTKGVTEKTKIYVEALNDLKTKPVFSDSYTKDECELGKKQGKKRLELVDQIRSSDIREFLSMNEKVIEWWNK